MPYCMQVLVACLTSPQPPPNTSCHGTRACKPPLQVREACVLAAFMFFIPYQKTFGCLHGFC